jgi:hypothetical protein
MLWLRIRIPSTYLLTCILVVELPVALRGPLRKCPPLVVIHIYILTPISHPPLCGRNQVLSVVFEAELEAHHCSCVFYCTGNHVPNVNDSVREKIPSYLQPSCLLPQIEWAVCTSGRSPSICCQLEPCPVVHSVYPFHNLESLDHIRWESSLPQGRYVKFQ